MTRKELPYATCTVVIPCYQAKPYLEIAVSSVLSQSFQELHLVLVDDGSRDGTGDLARRLAENSPQITVVELPENRGRSCARNRGTEVTRGPYVAFLDQDDTYHPDFLRVTTSLLSQASGLDAVKVLPSLSIEIDPIQYSAVSSSLATTMLMRRAMFEFIGGWPEDMIFRQHPGGCEDIALQQLLSPYFNVGLIEARLYHYNHRPGNALDRFLARSTVVDGNLIFQEEGQEDDRKAGLEIQRLARELREKVRLTLTEHLSVGANPA
jgi:glycosyltransferase involved in cell wall biosynthesis